MLIISMIKLAAGIFLIVKRIIIKQLLVISLTLRLIALEALERWLWAQQWTDGQ